MSIVNEDKVSEVLSLVLGIPNAIKHNQLKWHIGQLWRISKWKEPPNVQD